MLSINYTDPNGNAQLLTTHRVVDGGWGGSRILPAVGADWPATQRDTLNAVRVTFQAGYATGSPLVLTVPESIKQAMLMLVSQWFDERSSVVVGASVATLPFAVDALVAPYRVNLLV